MRTVKEIVSGEEWNRFVLSLRHYDVRQGFEWGEVRRTQGWVPQRLAVLEGDRCLGAMAILAKRVPFLRQAVLDASGGPLLADPDDVETLRALVGAVEALAAEHGAIFLRVSPAAPDTGTELRRSLVAVGFHHLREDWTTWNSPRIVMALGLQPTEQELSRKFRRRTREYILSAPRRGVTVRPAVSLEEGWAFHKSLGAVGRRKGLPVRGRAYFDRLWREYIRTGQGVLLLAEHRGRPAGGLLGVRLGTKASMLYVTLSDRADDGHLHQAPLLYWEFIRWAKRSGCEVLDWGGIGTNLPPREEDPGFGLYQFKRGFNSSLEYLTGYYDLAFRPRSYAAFRVLERMLFAVAWSLRAKLNGRFLAVRSAFEETRRKLRQFSVSLRQRGVWSTLYWGAFGFLRPNVFRVVRWSSGTSGPAHPPIRTDVVFTVWPAATLRKWRSGRHGLSTEFYQDEIDGVDTCAVALRDGNVAGLIWMYRPEDASRLFRLAEVEAELNHGYVLPCHRGQRLFRDLLAFSAWWLNLRGHSTIYAMVHSANAPSLAAFRDAGFVEVRTAWHFLAYRPKIRMTPAAPVVAPVTRGDVRAV
jgi:lipid II:glycine glycyltransferase (peptidoglycan interpeptide bridge formation enzyme)